jgi:type IV pilus assembly protein PilA
MIKLQHRRGSQAIFAPEGPPVLVFGRLHLAAMRGFSLIEVVIVMAIIAILALMVMPYLGEQTARQQIKDSMELAEVAKAGVNKYYAGSGGKFPSENAVAGVPAAEKIIGNFVTSVAIVDGGVNMTFGNNAHALIKGLVLSIRPAYVADTPAVPLSWVCAGRPVPAGMEVAGVNATTLKLTSLPVECR